jgi:hypothetical protein
MHNLEFRGRWLDLFGNVLLIALLAILTLGIYTPWGYARYQRMIATKTYYHDQPLQFDGSGAQVFVQYLIILALSLITLGLYPILGFAATRMLRWQYAHTIMPTGQRLEYRGNPIDLFFEYFLLGLFSALTLGIYAFWGVVQVRKFVLSRTYLDDKPLAFQGSGLQYLVLNLVNFLLTAITLGFFSLLQFATVRVLRWDAANTLVPMPERASRPMPAYSAPSTNLGVMPMEGAGSAGYRPELPPYGATGPAEVDDYPTQYYQPSSAADQERRGYDQPQYDQTQYDQSEYDAAQYDSQYGQQGYPASESYESTDYEDSPYSSASSDRSASRDQERRSSFYAEEPGDEDQDPYGRRNR